MKTLAIRLDDQLHARLTIVARLSGSTITDEIRRAIEVQIATKMSNPEITAKANAVLDDIEREAEAKREAIAALLRGR